jgi:hypothetical protein
MGIRKSQVDKIAAAHRDEKKAYDDLDHAAQLRAATIRRRAFGNATPEEREAWQATCDTYGWPK